MKDYSLNFEASKTFILNYKVKDNQIIINLASGENYVIPYTFQNEKKILERMKEQVLNSTEFENKREKKLSFYWKWAIFSGIMIVFNVVTLATGHSIIPAVSVIGAGLFGFDTIYRIYIMVDSKRKIKDINKNKMFLNNLELLNEKVRSNQNILSNIDTKTKELVYSTPEDKPVFTLNNMDEIEYEELRKILDNIKRDEQFGFDYSSLQEESSMSLTRKKRK